MRTSLALILTALLLVAAGLIAEPAAAADVKEVLAACDKMAASSPGSCGYSINDKNGDISGCVVGKNGPCFYCANDGKRQCTQVRSITGGSMIPTTGPDNLMTNMGTAPVPPKKAGAQAPLLLQQPTVAPQ